MLPTLMFCCSLEWLFLIHVCTQLPTRGVKCQNQVPVSMSVSVLVHALMPATGSPCSAAGRLHFKAKLSWSFVLWIFFYCMVIFPGATRGDWFGPVAIREYPHINSSYRRVTHREQPGLASATIAAFAWYQIQKIIFVLSIWRAPLYLG